MWRGLACLLVVVFHSSGVAYLTYEVRGLSATDPISLALLTAARIGWVGVPFFFVISGYAISATADVFRRRDGGSATYFKRRIRRIYPPYWAMLALSAVLMLVIDVILFPRLLTGSIAPIERPWTFTPGQWLGNLTLTESWRATALPFNSGRDYVLGQAWTLSYEEQFYIVTGLALLLWPARFFVIAVGVTIFSAVVPLLASLFHVRITGFFFDGYWLAFAAGVLVYWQVNYGSRRTSRYAWGLLATGVVYATLVFPDRGEIDRDLLAAVLFAAFLLGTHRFDMGISTSRWMRPMAFAGTICYSLYLSHAIIVRTISQGLFAAGLTSSAATVFITLPICVAAAVAVGWMFHRLVERHFLNRPTVRPVAPDAPSEAATETLAPVPAR